MEKSKKWIITTSAESLGDVQKSLADSGFNVEQVLDQIGLITGSASEDVAEQLRTIPGVTDISPDTNVDIGPPDEPVTW